MVNSGLCDRVTAAEPSPQLKRQLYIAWVPFQRRAVAMAEDFGYDLRHLGFAVQWRSLRPLEYLLKVCQTLWLLFQHRPQVLWIQMPPAPLLYLAFFYKGIFQPELMIIADCHNATFRRPWIQFPGVIALFNRCHGVVVHNPHVENQALNLGIQQRILTVLRDRTITPRGSNAEQATATITATNPLPDSWPNSNLKHTPWVLVPCSFNVDEPIAELLQAARLAPDITFVLTGSVHRAQGRHCLDNVPSNIQLPGFVSEGEFNHLLAAAHAIVGLTKLDGIQLSVANEALSYGQPMVLADTQLLRDFFPQGAIYVDPCDPEAIAQGCRRAIDSAEVLRQSVRVLRQEIDRDWQRQAQPLQRLVVQA